MPKETILVVDDEKEIADLVALYLQNEGFRVCKAYDAAGALDLVANEPLDLAVLDVMLPDLDGFQLCQKIRETHPFPIIMLTAKGEGMDKITGLSLGADDYMTKPFQPLELVARVKAQLRRYKKYNPARAGSGLSPALLYAGLELNAATHECTLNGSALSLTPTEFSILRILLERRGQVVSSEALFHEIWRDEYYSKSNNTITVHIRHLREKLGDTLDDPKYIKTIWGVGYKIGG